MPTTLPFLPSPATAAAAGGVTAAPDAALVAPAKGAPVAPADGMFAALIGAQLVPAAGQTGMAVATLAAAKTAAGATAAKTALAAGTGVPATAKISADAEPAPLVIVPANAPETTLSEPALTQAAGGKDDSTDAANAAIAAAIDAGVAPKPCERLVLAASLPVTVQTAATVRVLDQLLDNLSPTLPGPPAQVEPGTAGTTATVPPPAQAVVGLTATASLGAKPEPKARLALRDQDASLVTARPDLPKPAPVTHQTTAAPQALSNSARVLETPTTPVIEFDRNGANTPDKTPGTPPAQGEPAAPDNGKNAAHPADMLRQRLEGIGLHGAPSLTIDRGATAESSTPSPAALSHGILISPASATMLAAHGMATAGVPGQHTMASAFNGANGTLAAGAGGINAALTGAWQNSLGQGDGQGGSGTDGKSLQAGFSTKDGVSGGSEPTGDTGPNFGTLLTGQATGASALRPVSANAPPPPAPPPAITPDQVAVHIAAAARNGERLISVQLRPASLGRIDVQLSVGRDGSVRTRVLAERPETLDLLQRDAGGLERALEAAGLRAETGGLSFGLKDGSGQNGRAWFAGAPMPSGLITALDDDHPNIVPTALPPAPFDGRALDIRV